MRYGDSAIGRILTAVLLLGVAGSTMTACGGDGGGSRSGRVSSNPIPSSDFTAVQLQQALLFEIPGYRRTGEPDSGEYGSLSAIQNFNRLHSQVRLDKPQCAPTGRGFSVTEQHAPAALATFAKRNGQTV